MRFIGIILTMLLCALAVPLAAEMRSLDLKDRSFNLYQPDDSGDQPLALIVVLHGSYGSAAGVANHLPLLEATTTTRFRVVYLNATMFEKVPGDPGRVWNDGACCGEGLRPAVDDAAFIDAVIRDLGTRGLTRAGAVYMVGHSNGAQMAYRYVCDHGGTIAGLVAIAGALTLQNCTDQTGLSVLNIHGSEDDTIPLQGGRTNRTPEILYPAIADAGASLVAAGASFHLAIVPGAGHRLPSIDRFMRKSCGPGLADAVLALIFSGTIPKP